MIVSFYNSYLKSYFDISSVFELKMIYYRIYKFLVSYREYEIYNILNSCPTQGRVEGWDAIKPR